MDVYREVTVTVYIPKQSNGVNRCTTNHDYLLNSDGQSQGNTLIGVWFLDLVDFRPE